MTLLLPYLLFVAQVPTTPPPDKVVAKVGGQEIHASEIAPYLWDWYEQAALQEFITNKLILDEAAKRKIEVADKDIQDTVQKQLDQFKQSLPPGQDLDTALRERGMPRSRLLMRTKLQLLAAKIADQEFRPEDYVKTSTMAFQAKSPADADVKAAMDKAAAAYNKLKGGAKWEDVYKTAVTDPAMAQGNGQLDWNSIEAFPEEARKELRETPVKGYTHPVKTSYGIQIFRIDQKGPELKGTELDAVKARMMPRVQQSLVQKLREGAKIEMVP